MRLIASKLIFQCIITTTFSLNILLTSIDDWTSKDVRFLQSHLQQHGHNVVLIAPLYQQNMNLPLPSKFTPGIKDIKDGGEYGHLLPVHQKYYTKLSNDNQKRAKQVVFEDDVLKEEVTKEEADLVLNNQYGQDPSNHNAWYINCDAVNALNIAMNLLIPKHYPEFDIDLVIIGPNEGLHHQQVITSMINQVNAEKVDAIAVSTQDYHQVYYQDEKYFRTAFGDVDFQLSNLNVYTKNVKMIDRHVVSLVNKFTQLGSSNNAKLDGSVSTIGLHFQFPSMNFRHAFCQTSPTTDLDYQVMILDKKSPKIHESEVDIPVIDFEMELNGQIVEVIEDVESSRDHASFKFKNDDVDKVLSRNKKQRDATGNHHIVLDETLKSIDYVLLNCNVAVTTIGFIDSNKLKKLLLN